MCNYDLMSSMNTSQSHYQQHSKASSSSSSSSSDIADLSSINTDIEHVRIAGDSLQSLQLHLPITTATASCTMTPSPPAAAAPATEGHPSSRDGAPAVVTATVRPFTIVRRDPPSPDTSSHRDVVAVIGKHRPDVEIGVQHDPSPARRHRDSAAVVNTQGSYFIVLYIVYFTSLL